MHACMYEYGWMTRCGSTAHTHIHNVNPHQRTTLYLCPKICSALTHFFTLRMHHLTHTHYCLSFCCLTVLASLCAGTTSTIIAAAVGAAVVCIAAITVMVVVCVVLAKSKNKTRPKPARSRGRFIIRDVQPSNDIPMASATMIHQPVATVNAEVVAPSAGHLDIPVAYGQTQPAVQSEVMPVAYPLKM